MGFLTGKKLLITGVLSNRSIAYGIARACHAQGAELAFSYVGERFKDRITDFAAEFDLLIGSDLLYWEHLVEPLVDTLARLLQERGVDAAVLPTRFAGEAAPDAAVTGDDDIRDGGDQADPFEPPEPDELPEDQE